MMSNINNIKEKTTLEYNLTQINEFIDNSNINKLDSFVKNLHNADIAVKAANKRAYHIIDIMKKKNCKDSETLFNQLTKSSNRIISDEIRNLHKLYEKGALTKEEFERAKAKVLE